MVPSHKQGRGNLMAEEHEEMDEGNPADDYRMFRRKLDAVGIASL